MTVQAHCLSGYVHYPSPQPPAQLSPMLTELGVVSVKLNYPIETVVLLAVILSPGWTRQLMTRILDRATPSAGDLHRETHTISWIWLKAIDSISFTSQSRAPSGLVV